jgi:oligogalacturonide transport system substrate-binding protein
MKKLVCILLIALFVFSAFANGTQETATTKEQEEVTIRFAWWGDAARHEATLKAVELFEAKYPWIHVEPEYQGWDGWATKFLTQCASGTLADVVQDAGYVTYTRNQGSSYVDMNQFVGTVLNTDEFSKNLLDAYCTDPKTEELYLMPTGIQAWTTLQNNELLKACGVKMPEDGWTWEEMIPAAKALHEADPEAYLLNCSLETLCTWMLPMYIQQKVGGIVISDDSVLQFDEATLASYFQWVKDMYDANGLQPRSEAMLYDGSPLENPKWGSGKLAISQFSSASYTWYVYNDYLAANTEVVPSFKFSGEADNDTIIVPPASFYAIPSTSVHQKEAAMLINFLLNDIDAGRAQGTVRSIPANAAVLEVLSKENLINPGIAKAVELGSPRACVKRGSSAVGNDITLTYYDYIEEIAYGRMTPAEAAKACYADVQKLCDSVKK